jgi:hypothetical protein
MTAGQWGACPGLGALRGEPVPDGCQAAVQPDVPLRSVLGAGKKSSRAAVGWSRGEEGASIRSRHAPPDH